MRPQIMYTIKKFEYNRRLRITYWTTELWESGTIREKADSKLGFLKWTFVNFKKKNAFIIHISQCEGDYKNIFVK